MQLVCVDCAVGQHQDEQGQSNCKSCPAGDRNVLSLCFLDLIRVPGRASSAKGVAVCALCPRGFAINDTAQTQCTACDEGFFADQEGLVACLVRVITMGNGELTK